MSNKLEQVAVRVDETLRERLQAMADAERRPLAQLIRNVLRDAVEHAGGDAGARAA